MCIDLQMSGSTNVATMPPRVLCLLHFCLHATLFIFLTPACLWPFVRVCAPAVSIVTRCQCLGTEANNSHREPKGNGLGRGGTSLSSNRFPFRTQCHFSSVSGVSSGRGTLRLHLGVITWKRRICGGDSDERGSERFGSSQQSCFEEWSVMRCFDTVSQGRAENILEWR